MCLFQLLVHDSSFNETACILTELLNSRRNEWHRRTLGLAEGDQDLQVPGWESNR